MLNARFFVYQNPVIVAGHSLAFSGSKANGLIKFLPPPDGGDGFCEAKDGGRENFKFAEVLGCNSNFCLCNSLPQSRLSVRQLPHQREPSKGNPHPGVAGKY